MPPTAQLLVLLVGTEDYRKDFQVVDQYFDTHWLDCCEGTKLIEDSLSIQDRICLLNLNRFQLI